jgi:uridine phosphorylase
MLWCTFYQSNFVGKTPLTLCGPLLGAPQTVMAMEKLIVLGAERVWVLGWCGSIQAQLRIGDFLIPTHAFSEEGTSVHYPIGGRTPQAEVALSRRIERCLRLRNLPVTQGALWSTDAPYRETPRKVKTFQRKGALAVEMEMSALMTLSIYRSVGLSGLLVVSDELFDLRWHPGFKDPLLKKNTVIAAQVLLDVVASVL